MLDRYLNSQEIVTKLLMHSINDNKLSSAYLFVCDDIDFAFNYAKDFVKEIIKLSNLDENILNNIFKRIDNNEYTELKIIESDGNYIKKEQLINLQNSVLNKPVEANKIVYIIKNAEKLNSSSANSILKFLEEPEDDIIAILLTDNLNMIIPTIKSRCQVLNFKNVRNSTENNTKLEKYIVPDNIYKEKEEIDGLINSITDVIYYIEKKKINTFINSKNLFWDKFSSNDDILILLNFMIYAYMDSLYIKLGKDIKYMKNYEEILEIITTNNDIDDIITKVNLIEELKLNLKMNVNSKLLFDKMIIELSEV